MAKLTVMISGGFSLAYHAVLPDFERSAGISVTTLSGSSQGTGPKTIKWQLERGVEVDLVILSKEGLSELISADLVVAGSETELASVALGAAVRQGFPKPDIGNVDKFKQVLLHARLVAMPGSTSGLFVKSEVLPKLAIADKVSTKMMARGTESTAILASGEADLAIGPLSELHDQAGVEIVGPLPDDVQLVQIFSAAIVKTSPRSEEATRLIQYLASDRSVEAIERSLMVPAGERRGRSR
jgi:molybdate transport system substrate-binding protein